MDQSVFEYCGEALASAPARPNLYIRVHKGLRMFMCDTLSMVGRVDAADGIECGRALAQIRELLALLRDHLAHEDRFIHTAMERCRAGSSLHSAEEHLEHVDAIESLLAECEVAEAAGDEERARAFARLYVRLGRFVAGNLEHMQLEETHNMAVLWATLDDARLMEIEESIVASIPPQAMTLYQRWMLPAMNHAERVGTLEAMRANAPAQVFEHALGIAHQRLPQREWAKLAHALGVPAAAGLVELW